MMRNRIAMGAVALLAALYSTAPAAADCDRIPDCELVWADEFDGSAVDPAKWEFQTGTGTDYGLPAGWGNNELQYYQEANASVAGGFLTITARRETVGGRSYTSARMRTLGRAAWTYGRMEIRARMPRGQGLWPAFWMLPSDTRYGTWAASGEIDVVEYLGHEPERVFGTLHYGAPWPNNTSSGNEYDLPAGGFDEDFHVFAVEWDRGEIRWYVDGEPYASQTGWFSTAAPYPAPFDVDFHLLLNVAVGGNFPGRPDDTTQFPQELTIDYVRVYQAAAIKGGQSAETSLTFERPQRLKKVRGRVAMSFDNQARKRDRTGDPRRVDCSVDAWGPGGRLAAAGRLDLELTGERGGGEPWRGTTLSGTVGRDGRAEFAAEELAALVDEALAAGVEPERIEVAFAGKSGKKAVRVDVECRQRPAA